MKEHDGLVPEGRQGIIRKYVVRRTDGSSRKGRKHADCDYFVLDLLHDPFARPAIKAYARACAKEYPVLSAELTAWADGWGRPER